MLDVSEHPSEVCQAAYYAITRPVLHFIHYTLNLLILVRNVKKFLTPSPSNSSQHLYTTTGL